MGRKTNLLQFSGSMLSFYRHRNELGQILHTGPLRNLKSQSRHTWIDKATKTQKITIKPTKQNTTRNKEDEAACHSQNKTKKQ